MATRAGAPAGDTSGCARDSGCVPACGANVNERSFAQGPAFLRTAGSTGRGRPPAAAGPRVTSGPRARAGTPSAAKG